MQAATADIGLCRGRAKSATPGSQHKGSKAEVTAIAALAGAAEQAETPVRDCTFVNVERVRSRMTAQQTQLAARRQNSDQREIRRRARDCA